MVGMVGRDHGPLPFAFDQSPVVEGLELVVVGAVAVDLVGGRPQRLRPVLAVVPLGVLHAPAAQHGAFWLQPLQGGELVGVGLRPRWATLITSLRSVTTAAMNRSPLSMASLTAETGTGPTPPMSQTSSSWVWPRL